MFFRKRSKQEQEDYDRMVEQQRQALASQFFSLGGNAASLGQGVNTMGAYYPGISMASMQQQMKDPIAPAMFFRVEFNENGFVVRVLGRNRKAYVCTEPQEVADRILAAMVEFKMEGNK